MRLEPLDTLCIKVVGRLVEEQDVRLAEQQSAQGNPSSLASAEGGNLRIGRRALECVHGPLQLRVNLPSSAMLYLLGELSLPLYQCVHGVVVHRFAELEIDLLVFLEQVHDFLHTFLHDLYHCLVRVHLGLLLQIAYSISRSPDHFSLVALLHSCDYFHQRGFSGAVQTDDAYFGPVKE